MSISSLKKWSFVGANSFALAVLLSISPASATTSSPGTAEESDAACETLVPTVSVVDGRMVGGNRNGRQFSGTLHGTSGSDVIFGTDGDDRILGLSGDDVICAFGGIDRVLGGSGDDIVYLGSGNDTALGQAGDDRVNGGSGNDRLLGQAGNDTLDGGDGDDRLVGGASIDTCTHGESVAQCETDPMLSLVADVANLPLAQAQEALSPLESIVVAEEYDATVEAGNVISQNPAAGAEVADDTVVELVVSLGAEPQTVFTARVRVTTPEGTPINNVSISDAQTGVAFGSTVGNGTVMFDILDAQPQMLLRLMSNGYAEQFTPLSIVSGAQSASLDITMIKSVTASVSESDSGEFEATVNSNGSVVVTWDEGSFVSADGTQANDENITVRYSTVDVSNPAELEAFPGSFTGTSLDGSFTSIASLGTSEYVFSLNGTELQLAQGATATISLPLYIDVNPADGGQLGVGSMIPIWSLNESSGEWFHEVDGTVVASQSSPTGLAVEAQVTHFSWWNIDVPIETGSVTVVVNGGDFEGSTSVTAVPSNVAFRTGFGTVPVGGSYTTEIPAGSEYCFSGRTQLSMGQSVRTQTVCTMVFADTTQTINLDIQVEEGPLVIVADRLADNSGNVVINAFQGAPIPRVRIDSATIESNVTYSVNNVPAGVSLNVISGFSAELVGTPSVSGSFNAMVTGSTADGDTDTISIQYEIDELEGGDIPTVAVRVELRGNQEDNIINLNEVIEITADSWFLIGPDPLPVGLFFDGSNGEFMIPNEILFDFEDSYWDWTGVIRGTFSPGIIVNYLVTFRFI